MLQNAYRQRAGRVSIMAMLFCSFWFIQPLHPEVIPQERRVDWLGSVGVEGGIPYRSTVHANVLESPYNAAGDGVADDTAALQAAIDDCPPGEVVWIPSGTYRITDRLRMKSGVTVRGAGIGETLIKGDDSFTGPYLVGFEAEGLWFDGVLEAARNVAGAAAKGASQIPVSGSGWSVGDVVLIDIAEDPPFSTNDGTGGTCTWCGEESGDRPAGQVVEISAVQADSIDIAIPLYFDLDASLSPRVSRLRPEWIIAEAGLEDLSLDNSESHNPAQYNYGILYMMSSRDSWVSNVELVTTLKTGLKMTYSYRNTIRGCVIRNSHAYTSDAGYGLYFTYGVSASAIENNIFHDLTVGVIFNGPVSGNVVAYNYMTDMKSDTFPTSVRNGIIAHGAHPIMNLFEGNFLDGPGISCDFYWGTSSHNTFLRNRVAIDPTKTTGAANVSIWKGQTYYNLVGNVFGSDGYESVYESTNLYGAPMIYNLDFTNIGSEDGQTAATILRHGNYDSVNGGIVWDPAIPDQDVPPSYYLSERPNWWGGLDWPAVGPGHPSMYSDIPAKYRFENPEHTGAVAPPSRLRIQSP